MRDAGMNEVAANESVRALTTAAPLRAGLLSGRHATHSDPLRLRWPCNPRAPSSLAPKALGKVCADLFENGPDDDGRVLIEEQGRKLVLRAVRPCRPRRIAIVVCCASVSGHVQLCIVGSPMGGGRRGDGGGRLRRRQWRWRSFTALRDFHYHVFGWAGGVETSGSCVV